MILQCPVCNGEAEVLRDEGAVHVFGCTSCRHEFYVRVHPVGLEDSIGTRMNVYKACVRADDLSSILKNRIKISKIFNGYDNFSLDDLCRQIERGETCWDLGLYIEDEIKVLLGNAEKIGLKVSFFLRCRDENGRFFFMSHDEKFEL
jgi:hypothetical protein